MSTKPQHAYTGPAIAQLPEPSAAERVRTLFALASVATLSTWSKKVAGFPFGSLMPYALDERGRPVFLISNMAMHTQNVKADARASLFCGPTGAEDDPLGAARATLVGTVEAVPAAALPGVKELYLARHEKSRYWVDFDDFGFFRLEPIEIYYVGGFGVMGWVSAAEYAAAEPDPLAGAAAGILAHMNVDHEPAMIGLARAHAGIEAETATMTAVDRLGFSLRLKTVNGMKGARVNFLREVTTPEQTRTVLMEMVRALR